MLQETMQETSFDLVEFINKGFEAQQKYAEKVGALGPRDFAEMEQNFRDTPDSMFLRSAFEATLPGRYEKIIEYFGHLVEESVEARVYVPRRSWKNGERSYLDNPQLREEFVAEMYDILLFFRAILAYAGVSGEEFAQIAAKKQAYNQVRTDHNVNGTDVVNASPAEELQGSCHSATFNA